MPTEKHNNYLHFLLDQDSYDRLQEIAESEYRTRSEQIRMIVMKKIYRYFKGISTDYQANESGTLNMSIPFSQRQLPLIQAYCEQTGDSVSSAMRNACLEYLENYKEPEDN